MVAVPFNGDVLVWARKQRGLSPAKAAELLKVSEADLFELERNNRDLTYGELERIAQQYQFPVATLLMPAPLPDVPGRKMRDFRVFDGERAVALTTETLVAIEDTHELADALDDLRYARPSLFAPFQVPECTLVDDAEQTATRERERLNIRVEEQFAWFAEQQAFLRWREVVEAQGVFTYQLPLGDDDSRGFAIWDEREIPIIVIDSKEEGYPARVFTLWHEYAHILLRLGGISNQNRRDDVERFCNQFAAYFLMPRDVFSEQAAAISPGSLGWGDEGVTRLAKRFKVSKSAVALHLEDLGFARAGFFHRMQALWRSRKGRSSRGAAVSHIVKHANRLGSRHVDTVMKAYETKVISKLDVYAMTDVKPQYFEDLKREIAGRRAAYGRYG
jgi:Zn-dependent peptidase ImmA (M78 family)